MLVCVCVCACVFWVRLIPSLIILVSFVVRTQDGTRVYTAGCDGKAKLWSLQTGQATQIAQVSVSS